MDNSVLKVARHDKAMESNAKLKMHPTFVCFHILSQWGHKPFHKVLFLPCFYKSFNPNFFFYSFLHILLQLISCKSLLPDIFLSIFYFPKLCLVLKKFERNRKEKIITRKKVEERKK